MDPVGHIALQGLCVGVIVTVGVYAVMTLVNAIRDGKKGEW